MTKKDTQNFDLDPESFGGEDFPPWNANEVQNAINQFHDKNPNLKQVSPSELRRINDKIRGFSTGSNEFYEDEPWIQTYSGRRFNPTKPYVDAIVIQDIAHSLSMQCRFSGHVKQFYSVAQHSVLVSYLCDSADALWGLLHDASEAYLVDVPRPLKRSGKFDAYLEFEKKMSDAICQRFGLPEQEPPSVKRADQALLSTEARDLMSPLHKDWVNTVDPYPFKIDPLGPQDAKNLFMKRFFDLTGTGNVAYIHYLATDGKA